jgi:hypothetical protein
MGAPDVRESFVIWHRVPGCRDQGALDWLDSAAMDFDNANLILSNAGVSWRPRLCFAR